MCLAPTGGMLIPGSVTPESSGRAATAILPLNELDVSGGWDTVELVNMLNRILILAGSGLFLNSAYAVYAERSWVQVSQRTRTICHEMIRNELTMAGTTRSQSCFMEVQPFNTHPRSR